MAATNSYTTRQAASIGLQPGNLVGETHYVTETQITPPVKQRVRTKKLLSTNISRCQCCCPPIASSLCRSCLCPCWAYLLIGLLFALLLAALAVELGFLTREKVRLVPCVKTFNTSAWYNGSDTEPYFTSTATATSGNCSGGAATVFRTSIWSSFPSIFLIINAIIYLMKF